MSDTERLQVGRSVDGLLRDRIAAVIQENLVWEAPNMSARLADAVITDLGLRQEPLDGYVIQNGLGQTIREKVSRYRYVTEWTTDE